MTTSDYLTQLQQDREDLVDNLEAKGITGLSGDETFTELVPQVLNIPSGVSTGAYSVGSVAEMNSLTGMSAGDYCLVNAIPSTYTPYDYLEGHGEEYINIYLIPTKCTTEVKFQVPVIPETHGTAENFCGVWNPNNQRYYVANVRYDTNKFTTTNRSNAQTVLANYDSNPHVVIYNDNVNRVLFDGESKATISDITSGTYTMYLFALNDGGPAAGILQGRLFYVKINSKENGLVRYMIPCKRNSDDILGMYDMVNDVFYTNAGTGNFTVGNQVYSSYYKVYQYNTQDGWVLVNGNIVN